MNVGDLVRVKLGRTTAHRRDLYQGDYHGIILYAMERDTGFFEYQVYGDGGSEWFCDLELEVISEDR
tara:strand:- start:3469 stop:3669 length:201 start_codon:yes stop_codon:yes gene_type:complete